MCLCINVVKVHINMIDAQVHCLVSGYIYYVLPPGGGGTPTIGDFPCLGGGGDFFAALRL